MPELNYHNTGTRLHLLVLKLGCLSNIMLCTTASVGGLIEESDYMRVGYNCVGM